VTPFGNLIAVPARGTLMGNRGCLHDESGAIRRPYVGKRWIICLLQFKGRRQTIMTPGRYTHLFFLDEATALAAGHRPCAECQRERFNLFRTLWAKGNVELGLPDRPTAVQVDEVLHGERINPKGARVTYHSRLGDLPAGTFVRLGEGAYLVWGDRLLRWSPGGYDLALPRRSDIEVDVLTPRSTVRALAAGYPVTVHQSAR